MMTDIVRGYMVPSNTGCPVEEVMERTLATGGFLMPRVSHVPLPGRKAQALRFVGNLFGHLDWYYAGCEEINNVEALEHFFRQKLGREKEQH